jgi:ABC transporter substrate binding protein
MTTRRKFLAGITAALAPGPLAAQTQPQSRMRRLGVLMGSLASDGEGQKRAAALVQGLGALNWREGGNLQIDWRWAGGDPALFKRYATEMVALSPEVLLAEASPSVEALRRQTSTIPIVFLIVTDPVGQGFVESLARPGGNITGFSNYDPPMSGKWLGMLREITPPVARVAVLYNPATAPYAGLYLRTIEDIAPALAVTVQTAPVKDDAEIEAVMAGLTGEQGAGLLVLPDTFTRLHRDAIVALAARYRLPAVYPFRYFAAAGGPDVLRHRDRRPVPALGRLCRSPPERRQSERATGSEPDQVRTGDQSEDRQCARHHHPALVPRLRRRGDRVIHPTRRRR